MSFTEIVQHTGEVLDHQPINWDLAITWIVIVAVGCWLWAEIIEFLEGRRMDLRSESGDATGRHGRGVK
jgi:hypothetical protein